MAARRVTASTAKNPVKNPTNGRGRLSPHLIPGNPGNSGGKKGRSGRPPNELRQMSREIFEAYLRWARKRVTDPDIDDATMDRIGNVAGKYGLGTTITETDTEGNDVTIRVVRSPMGVGRDN